MNILITGGTGFVGSHMIDYILKHAIKPDQKIYCTKRWMEDTKNVDHIDDERFEFIHYLLQLTFYALIILFVYILGMHFLGNSI